jgi:hypothetical protein
MSDQETPSWAGLVWHVAIWNEVPTSQQISQLALGSTLIDNLGIEIELFLVGSRLIQLILLLSFILITIGIYLYG